MNPTQLLQHFDRISEAPDAVPRLRRFVLDLAVRGKLVEQDSSDEPAAELLKRIQAEKTQLVEDGRARKAKPVLGLGRDAIPFSLPASWQWSQLALVGFISPRNDAADDLMASFVPMPLISAEYGVPNQHEVRPWGEIKTGYTHFAEGDVGLAKITPCFENAKSTIFRRLTGGIGAGTTELHIVRPVIVRAEYLLIFLKCPHFINAGVPIMTGTAGQKRVPADYFARTPLPIPPLLEQHRIVAKVDELMALCDRLEAAQTKREQRRDRLVTASLRQLEDEEGLTPRRQARQDNSPPSLASLAPWRETVFLQNVPRLTTRPEHIKALRQTILNVSVCGRLIANDSRRSETSCVDHFEREEARTFGMSVRIPPDWSWCCVADLLREKMANGISIPGSDKPPGIRALKLNAITQRGIDASLVRYLPLQPEKAERIFLQAGDFLLARGNGSKDLIARGGFVKRAPDEATIFPDTMIRLRLGNQISQDWFNYVWNSSITRAQIEAKAKTAVGLWKISQEQVGEIALPVPPLDEQHRIVAKVDELMAICDHLEANLTTTQTDSRRLLEAVLRDALAPALEAAA